MKRDYYSDIKLAERIIFQNTAYLLTMIDKKVDSFTSQKTPNMRARERNDLLHPDNVLHPEAPRAILNPLATLANDLTKPVWNCITRVEPVAVSLLPQFGSQTQAQRLISAFNQSMIRFFQRFKYEHQDEVSLKLHINLVDRLNKVKSLLADFEQKKPNQNQLLLQKLFGMLQAVYRLKFSNSTAQEYLAILQTLQKSTLKDPVRGVYINPDIVADVTIFVQQIEQYIKNVAESLSGPVYINYTLQQQKLSLILHPMMLAIYCSIKNQINHQEEGKEDMNSKNSFFQSKVNTEPPIFQQLKSYNCSKITFINMDGYQSSSNLFLAKHLRKYLQYISFPLQEQSFLNNNMQLNDLASYYRWRSQILAKQYMACFYEHQANINLYGGKDSNQRQTFEQLFKRLLVIPVNSLYISNKTDAPSISGFQSQFVYFMMKEIIYNQIRQFGPSVIIVSHSKTLPMLSSHLQQIFAQLSILTNMKIIFYNNITHSIVPYVTEQKKDYFLSNHIKYYTLKQQWSSPLAFHNQVQRFPITIDMLERASIFFKICSGTANLTFEARQSDQKFYNSKILRYSGLLMRKIGQKHPVLSKFDHRFLHYLKIDKLFTNYPQNDQNLSVYHRRVFDLAQKELILRYGQDFLVSTQMKSFFQQYCIRLIKQRQNQETKYITKLSLPNQKEQNYGLIALQFQTCQNQTSQLVSLNQNSQILISTTKKYQNCPVFVLNHLNRDRNQLFNYFGFADQTIEKSCEARVKLLPLVFQQNYYNIDPTYQHLTQFNFHQTQTSVIFFWPVLYDAKQALLHNFQRISYNPKITSLFFVGSKADLRFLSHLQPVNESYRSIHPRIGCTCYQLPLSNSIYVFGGFYTDIDNYMDFQTDISVIKLEKDFGISIENVPKSFFMNFQQQSSFKMVTSVNNDFVRPRVQYEVYELQNQVSDVRQILLLGGVGEKFTRPFSLIGYMAHLIRFQGPYLSKIDRIKINNIVPANLSRPIKSRANSQMPLIKVAQNRRIYASKSSIHPGVLTFSSFKPKYISQDQNQDKKCLGKHMARNRRMTYTKNYEVALQEKWTQLQYPKQNTYTVSLREGNQTRSYRCILRHYSYKSKNQASVLLTIEAKQLLFLNLIFCLQDDAAEKFINLQGKTVKLAPHNVVAADTFFKDVFVLFYHQQFSQGMFVLARSNVKNTTQLIQNGVRQLVLNQIYSFDFIPQKCIIKVVQGQGQQIALLHGLSFSEQNYEEYLLKRIGSYYTRLPIYRSDLPLQIGHSILMKKNIVEPNKKSFIIGSGHKIFCISFITIERVQGTAQVFYVVVEELNLNETVLKWRIKSHNKFIFELNTQEIIEFQTRDQNRPPEQQIIFRTKNYMVNKQILDVYETTESRDIFIVLTDQRYIYEGSINIENLGKFNNLLFLPIKSQDRFMLYQNYGTQRLRDRSNGFHIYAKAIDKDTTGIRSQTQIISQEIGTIDIL